VKEIELCRVGGSTPLRYHIGSRRPFSVYVTTNEAAARLNALAEALTRGGYYVSTSNSLDRSTNGTVIHYEPKAEMAAREIAQRLISQFGLAPQLTECELVSEYDIIIWLGKDTSRFPSVGAKPRTILERR